MSKLRLLLIALFLVTTPIIQLEARTITIGPKSDYTDEELDQYWGGVFAKLMMRCGEHQKGKELHDLVKAYGPAKYGMSQWSLNDRIKPDLCTRVRSYYPEYLELFKSIDAAATNSASSSNNTVSINNNSRAYMNNWADKRICEGAITSEAPFMWQTNNEDYVEEAQFRGFSLNQCANLVERDTTNINIISASNGSELNHEWSGTATSRLLKPCGGLKSTPLTGHFIDGEFVISGKDAKGKLNEFSGAMKPGEDFTFKGSWYVATQFASIDLRGAVLKGVMNENSIEGVIISAKPQYSKRCEMDFSLAKSSSNGNEQVTSSSNGSVSEDSSNGSILEEKLKMIKSLVNQGLITEAEAAEKRRALLAAF